MWPNTALPLSWITWHKTLSNIYKGKCTYSAPNKAHFIAASTKYMPYLSGKQIGNIHDELNKNIEYYDKEDVSDQVRELCKKKFNFVPNRFIKSAPSVSFASPSLLVNSAFHILSLAHDYIYVNAEQSGSKLYYVENVYHINYCFLTRTEDSYTDGKLHGESKHNEPYLYQDAAKTYSTTHWKEYHQRTGDGSIKVFRFSDPSQDSTNALGGAKHIYNIAVLFDTEYNKIDSGDELKSTLQVYDQHTQVITHDTLLQNELQGGRSCQISSPISMVTGGSLLQSHCPVTGVTFRKNHCMYGGNPIHEKVYNYIKSHEQEIIEYFGLAKDARIVPNEELYEKAKELAMK
jgi:hypothetical protein